VFSNILIVEDEAIIALDLELKLENLGYNVVCTVSSGADALRFVQDSEVDLIFMDIFLKGKLTGVEAAVMIREEFNIPIIYNSANSDPKTFEMIKNQEDYEFLMKPFDDAELQKVINRILKFK
jgi:Response regulator containing CheY-like receiver, AAA-type ATPase, and DNA-binding domains